MHTAALHHPHRLAAAVLVVAALAVAASVAPIAQGKTPCSSFGTTWARSYNRSAARDQNPIRIIAACCKPIAGAHASACLVTTGFVGVREYGCELVDISPAGIVVGEGKHATTCA